MGFPVSQCPMVLVLLIKLSSEAWTLVGTVHPPKGRPLECGAKLLPLSQDGALREAPPLGHFSGRAVPPCGAGLRDTRGEGVDPRGGGGRADGNDARVPLPGFHPIPVPEALTHEEGQAWQ